MPPEETTIATPTEVEAPIDVQGVVDEATGGLAGGQSLLPEEPSPAVVSTEPARELVQQNENFLAETEQVQAEAAEAAVAEAAPTEAPTGLTAEEVAATREEEPTADELRVQDEQRLIEEDDVRIDNELTSIGRRSDSITRTQISSIQEQFGQLQAEARSISEKRQAGLRVLGLRTGRAQFAAEIQSGIIAGERRALVETLTKIQAAEDAAIAEAQSAQFNRDFELANTQINLIREQRAEKKEVIDSLNANIQKQRDSMLEENERIERETSILNLVNQGINDPVEIFGALQGKTSIAQIQDVFAEISRNEFQATGQAGQFQALKNLGQIPEGASFEDYLNLTDPTRLLDVENAQLTNQKLRKQIAEGTKPVAGKPPSTSQFTAAGFAKRLEQAQGVFDELEVLGFDPTTTAAAAQRADVFGLGVPEAFKSQEAKRQDQAERNFVNAVLRRESGAAISPEEFISAEKQYFPRIGDGDDLLEQKKENREIIFNTLKSEAGQAFDQIDEQGGFVDASTASVVSTEEADPVTAPIGSTFEINGVRYRKIGEDEVIEI